MEAHVHHNPAETWLASLSGETEILLCPWTEIGAMRVAMQTRHVGNINTARALIDGFRPGCATLLRIADNSPAAHLPNWVKTPRQMADGHLIALAKTYQAELATLHTGIPGAFLIP